MVCLIFEKKYQMSFKRKGDQTLEISLRKYRIWFYDGSVTPMTHCLLLIIDSWEFDGLIYF